MKKLNKRLTQIRNQRGINQAQLATAIGVSPSCISNWESGKSIPRTRNLILIVKFFNVKMDFLLGLKDNPFA